jgi:AraC-like DNA-binding protein
MSLSCFDSEQLRYAVKNSEFDLQQLNKGAFQAELFSADLGKGILDKAYYGKSMLNHGVFSSDYMLFGILFKSDKTGTVNGQDFHAQDIILCDEGAEIEYYSTDDSYWSSLQFKRSDLHALGVKTDKPRPSPYHIRNKTNQNVSKQVQYILNHLEQSDTENNIAFNQELLYNHLLTLYARTLENDENSKTPKRTESSHLAKKIHSYIHRHADVLIQMIDLTRLTGKSERTVERIFKKHFGLTPYKYLKIHRLNLIRKQLQQLKKEDEPLNITQIAMNNGFFQMGYFGCEYKKMFSETASETLKGRS